MKKTVKIILITLGILIVVLLVDSIQALVFDNSPLFRYRVYYNGGEWNYRDKGLLVDTVCGTNGQKDTVLKGFSPSIADDTYDEAYKKNEVLDIAKLNEMYPEFFNISTDGGLTVYVWQMAKDDYRCYLTNKIIDTLTDQSFLFEKGARHSEMKVILSSYDLKKEDVDIHLITNPISSFFPDWDIIEQGEDKNEKIDSYINRIREMLFNQ